MELKRNDIDFSSLAHNIPDVRYLKNQQQQQQEQQHTPREKPEQSSLSLSSQEKSPVSLQSPKVYHTVFFFNYF